MTASKPTARITYGTDPLQFGELRLPAGKGPHPVAILIHGGCWLSQVADLKYFGAMADALTRRGLATWNIEYRRVGDKGGGWPGTFLDVARATDHLRTIAKDHPLDLARVVAVGHSAGGHLALWLAARHKLAEDGPLLTAEPLKLIGVVNLAGPGDLAAFAQDGNQACGDAIEQLLGGSAKAQPDRYRQASPVSFLPLGVPQVCISGAKDRAVPSRHVREYAIAANKAGDDAEYIELPEAGHFEVVAPTSAEWKDVEDAIQELTSQRRD